MRKAERVVITSSVLAIVHRSACHAPRGSSEPVMRIAVVTHLMKSGVRGGAEVDFGAIVVKALETGTLLEINSQPNRLDLSDVHARAAREAGLKLVVSTDAHEIPALDYVRYGIGQARRAWCTAEDIANTRTWKQLDKLRKKRS